MVKEWHEYGVLLSEYFDSETNFLMGTITNIFMAYSKTLHMKTILKVVRLTISKSEH